MDTVFQLLVLFLCVEFSDAVTFNSAHTTSVNENDDRIVNLWSLSVTCSPQSYVPWNATYTIHSVDCTDSCVISGSYEIGLFEIASKRAQFVSLVPPKGCDCIVQAAGKTLRKKACSDTTCGSCNSCTACSAASGCTTSGQPYSITITCSTTGYDVDDSDSATTTMSVTGETPALSLTLASPVSANNGMSVGDVVTTATITSGLTARDWVERTSVANSYLLGTTDLFKLDTSTGEIKVNKDPSLEYSYTYSMQVCVYTRRQSQCKTTTINFSGCFQTPTCEDQMLAFVNDTHGIGGTLFTMDVPDPSPHFASISGMWQGLSFTEVSSTFNPVSVDSTTGAITTTGNITVHPNYPSVTHTTVVRVANSASCSYTTTCTMTYTVFFTNWLISITNTVTNTTIHEDEDAQKTLFNITTFDGNAGDEDNVTCTLSTANSDLFFLDDDGAHDYNSYSIVKKTCQDMGCGLQCSPNIGCMNWNQTMSYTMSVTCADAYGSNDTKTFTVTVERNEPFVWRNLPMTITVNSDTVAQWDILFSVLYSDAELETLTFNFSTTPPQPALAPLFALDSRGNYHDRLANLTSLTYQWDLTNTTYVLKICAWDRRNIACEELTINIREFCGPTPTCTADSVSVTDQFSAGGSLFNITVPSSGTFSGLSYAITTEHPDLFDVNDATGEITTKTTLSVNSPPNNSKYTVVGLVYDTVACEYASCEFSVNVSFTNFPISIDNMAVGAVSVSLHEDTGSAVTLHTIVTSDANTIDGVNCAVDESNSVPANNGKFYTEESDTNANVYRIVSKDGPEFDYDVTQSYVIYVVCSDAYGSSDSANMTVTILENQPPTMDNLDNTTIVNVDPLTTFSGDVVFTLMTSDAENDALTYSCSVDNTWVPLECLSDGVVSLRRNVIIPDENGTLYNMTMCIYEALHNHTLCAQLTVNFTTAKTHPFIDNLAATVYVAEDAAVNTVIYNVTVSDPDVGDVHTFALTSITPDETASTFSFDSSSGVLTLSSSLDYETYSNYNFKFSVSDQYLTSLEEKTLVLMVNNMNEAPTLVIYGAMSFNTTEGVSGRAIGKLNFTCTDPDINEGLDFRIISGSYRHYFSLNAMSGKLTHLLDWDFESASLPGMTTLTVSCFDDEGLSSTATLTVSIATVNEFAPVLNTYAETITIYSNQTLIESLLNVTSSDADYGHDGNFSYGIVGVGNGAKYFTMTSDGELRLAQYITWAYNFTFEFTILVSDNENDPLTSSIDVIVTYIAEDTTTEPTKPTYCILCRTEGIIVVSALILECILIMGCLTHICVRMKVYSVFQNKPKPAPTKRPPQKPTTIKELRKEIDESDLENDDSELEELSEDETDEPENAYRPGSECMNRALPSRRPPSVFNYYAAPPPGSPPPPPVYEDPAAAVDLSRVPEPVASPSQIFTTEMPSPKKLPRRGIRTIAELAPIGGPVHAPRTLPQLYNDEPSPTVSPERQLGQAALFEVSSRRSAVPRRPQKRRRPRQPSAMSTAYYPDIPEVMSPAAPHHPHIPSHTLQAWEPPGQGDMGGRQSNGLDF